MKNPILYFILITTAIFLLAGCGTVPKKFKEEVGDIKTRVETLESRVDSVETKQAEVERAAGETAQELEGMKEKAKRSRTAAGKPKDMKSHEGVKEIQICLKNAGYYKGKIDGIKGRSTRRAIRDFQQANGLKADGVVGKKTWEFLSKYSQGPVEEGAVVVK
jgi:murein L,D-transpeptidase YcbB/YkuD